MPFAPSVKTSFAPRIFSSFRRSMLIVSGIVRISFKPFGRRDERQRDAGVAARRLDENGVRLIAPDFSASSIIATPMRSLTLESGLKNSSLSNTSATAPCFLAVRFSRTSGVLPMVCVMSLNMRAITLFICLV